MAADFFEGDYSAVVVDEPVGAEVLTSDSPTSASDQGLNSITKLLGSIGTTARNLGTAVGTAKRDIKGAGAQYRAGEKAAERQSKVQQWWMYSTTNDKLVIGLAIAGIAIALYQVKKG